MSSSKNTSRGMRITDVLLTIFIVLKLLGVINWSWWVVLTPLWISLALLVIYLAVMGAVALIKQ